MVSNCEKVWIISSRKVSGIITKPANNKSNIAGVKFVIFTNASFIYSYRSLFSEKYERKS